MVDLLVIGPGRLGMLVARGWRDRNPNAKIFLKFNSENPERSSKMCEEGFIVFSSVNDNPECRADRIVFCAPPTGNPKYAEDVGDGLKYLKENGVFVFTSSGSVYAENSGGTVNEESELTRTERSGKIIDAENVVVSKNGCVIRLGGLYSPETGAHNFYARGGDFNVKGEGFINLINYQDAAAAVICAFDRPDKVKSQVFLAADGVPMTRSEILAATRSCHLYRDGPEVKFTGGDGVDGKKYDCTKIRDLLQWKPEHSSFSIFMSKL